MPLTTQEVNDTLVGRWPEIGDTCVPCGDPPTASEELARILVVEMLLLMYYEDPDSVDDVDGLRDLWDGMLENSHAERIAAGVAHLWP